MGADISMNITLVGASHTGKSTIVYKYTGRNYLKLRQHIAEMQPMTTIHSIKHYDNKYYQLCICDTCGSSMCDIQSFNLCHNADAIIICFNIHKPSTFKTAEKWINDLTQKNNKNQEKYPIILLIGTTKYSNLDLSKHEKHKEAQQISKIKNIFYQTVCLTDIQQIKQIFTTIIDSFIAPKNKDNIDTVIDNDDDDKKEESITKLEILKSSSKINYNDKSLKIKIILLGDINVGKTTYRQSFGDDHDDCTYFKTIKTYRGGYDFKILLMDPCGQEKFKNITKNYYRGCHGVILMTDVTNKNSFNNIKNFWMKQVSNNCNDDILKVLLINKMDLIDENNNNKITENIKNYGKLNNLKTYNISCKNGEFRKNINKSFYELINDIIYNQKLFHRLKDEQNDYKAGKFYIQSQSFIKVDRKAYDPNDKKHYTRNRTCNICD